MCPSAREHGPEPWRRRLYLPAYTVADAARYARTHPNTIAYWHYGGRTHGPALPGKQRGALLNYLQLVEAAFVATFRHLGVSLHRIRLARQYLAQIFGVEYPFAQLRLKTEGYHVLMDLLESEPSTELRKLIVADDAGQLGWESLVGERFAEFDYEDGLAVVWHPAGRQSPVRIDPRISFGAPVVRGVPTWTIRGRFEAGESVEDIAEDFGLKPEQVEQALEFEQLDIAA